MRKDYKPKWSPITEVPVIPVHEDMAGRDAPSQHPIEAIDGLTEALAGKVDADATKGLSANDYTDIDKSKLDGIAEGAETNVINSVKVNGTALIPDGDRAVDVTVPLALDGLSYEGGVLTATDTAGTEVASVDTGLGSAYVGASFDPSNSAIVFDTSAGDEVSMPMPSYRDGAEPNVIDGIVYDGVTASPDASKVVALDVYTKAHSVQQAEVDASTGVLTLKNANGDAISAVQTGLGGLIASASYDQANLRIDLVKADGSHLYIPLNLAVRPYAGTDSILLVPTDSATQIWLNPDLESGIRHAVKDNADAVATGNYTFQGPTAFSGPTAGLSLKSTKGAADTGQATCIYHYLTGDGSEALTAYDDIYLQSTRIVKRMRLTGRGGASHTFGIVANDDGTGYAVAPSYLPSDGNGGTAAPSDGTTVITQAMLAASPSVVHTTGDETIGGSKTFTGGIYGRGAQFDGQFYVSRDINLADTHPKSTTSAVISKIMRRVPTAEGSTSYEAVSQNYVFLGTNSIAEYTTVSGRNGSATATLVAKDDGTAYATAPSLLVGDGHDGVLAPSDGDTVITQSMLAASPTVMRTSGDQSIAGAKTFTGTVVEAGAISSKSVVTPSVQTVEDTACGWYKVYEISVTTNVTHTLVLWSSPTSPVVGSSYPMGVLVASIRGSSCVLKWETGMAGAEEADLQKTALVCTETESGYTWALWQKADGASIGRYLHRMAEYTMNGPSSGWTAVTPTAADAQESLPSGDNITVHYSEA
jgi:hypothetical protein